MGLPRVVCQTLFEGGQPLRHVLSSIAWPVTWASRGANLR